MSLSAPGMLDILLCFEAFDQNQDGMVDQEEFLSFLSFMGIGISPRSLLSSAVRHAWVPCHFSSPVSLSGCLRADVSSRRGELDQLWDEADVDHSGKLNFAEFLAVSEALFDVKLVSFFSFSSPVLCCPPSHFFSPLLPLL